MERNYRLEIFENLVPVFTQEGMRLNVNKFREYLVYTQNNKADISYEEFIGEKVRPTISLQTIHTALDLAERFQKVFLGGIMKRRK